MVWQILSNIDDHSGYEFPFIPSKILPFGTSNTFHNYHHLMNIGNYAAHLLVWDSIFGTCVDFQDHFEVREKEINGKGMTTIKAADTLREPDRKQKLA